MSVIQGIMANPLPFPTPATVVVSGASGSGKSWLTSNILQNADWCFDKPTDKIVYCYAHHQPIYETLEQKLDNIQFYNCLPTEAILEEINDPAVHSILVIDDYAAECARSSLVEALFTRISHHGNLSLIILAQNLYESGAHRRTQSLNTQINILMRNPMGIDQINVFARQRFPGRSRAFLDTFHKVTSAKFTYLVIDAHPQSEARFNVRTGLFPGDDIIVYQFP